MNEYERSDMPEGDIFNWMSKWNKEPKGSGKSKTRKEIERERPEELGSWKARHDSTAQGTS